MNRCQFCKYWDADDEIRTGLFPHIKDFKRPCRRHAPIGVDSWDRAKFPWTENADWCGDFEDSSVKRSKGPIGDLLSEDAKKKLAETNAKVASMVCSGFPT